MSEAHPIERFLFSAARELQDGEVAFIGFHWPMVAARIARRLHAPDLVVVYEGGIVEDRPTPELSTSPSDLRAAVGAAYVGGSIDALFGQLSRGRVERTFLEAPIVDRRGNVNTSVVGDYDHPRVRLPGSGGGTELGSFGRGLTLLSTSTNPRSFPASVDYITSPGYLHAPGMRARLGYPVDRGPEALLTPLGRFTIDDEHGVRASAVHAGVDAAALATCFPWLPPVDVASLEVLPGPSETELRVIREVLDDARATRYRLPEGLGR